MSSPHVDNDRVLTPYIFSSKSSRAVQREGRISPGDLGFYQDSHIPAHTSLVQSLKSFTPGLTLGIQLSHAGRKASTWPPFHRGEERLNKDFVTEEEGGWENQVYSSSAIPYGPGHVTPKELSVDQIKKVEDDFVEAAHRASKAGYDFVELHCAHGYLLHSFLSPLSNQRQDQYGDSFENRSRLTLDIVKRIRSEVDLGVWVRVSATDYCEHLEGTKTWDLSETQKLAKCLNDLKVQVLDVSAGGLDYRQNIKSSPGYQVKFASAIKKLDLEMKIGTVGCMESMDHPGTLAEETLKNENLDLIFLARGMLARPSWLEDAGVNLMGVRPAGMVEYHRGESERRQLRIGQVLSTAFF